MSKKKDSLQGGQILDLPSFTNHPLLKKAPNRLSARKSKIGILFTSPAIFFVALVMVYPLGYLTYLSFHIYRPLSSPDVKPAGLSNYVSLLTDPTMRKSMAVTLIFTLVSVSIELIIGSACAILLGDLMLRVEHRLGRGYVKVLGSLFIVPFAVPAVAGAYAWRMILDARFGVLNDLLDTQIPWLVDHPVLSIIVIDSWKMTPFILFVMLAAVMSIEPTQYEAASLDGAGTIRQLIHITIPSVLPIALIAAGFRAVDAFTKVFDTVFATTGGGPGDETRVLPLLIWRTAFSHLNFGTAAAQAMIALIISVGFGAIILVRQRKSS